MKVASERRDPQREEHREARAEQRADECPLPRRRRDILPPPVEHGAGERGDDDREDRDGGEGEIGHRRRRSYQDHHEIDERTEGRDPEECDEARRAGVDGIHGVFVFLHQIKEGNGLHHEDPRRAENKDEGCIERTEEASHGTGRALDRIEKPQHPRHDDRDDPCDPWSDCRERTAIKIAYTGEHAHDE